MLNEKVPKTMFCFTVKCAKLAISLPVPAGDLVAPLLPLSPAGMWHSAVLHGGERRVNN